MQTVSVLERIPELVCPECHRALQEQDDLRCAACNITYEVRNGIPHMLHGNMKAFAEEIAVQDRVASEYEQKRYNDPYAKRYHDWWTDQMLARVNKKGRILDNGCGMGLLLDKVNAEQVVGLDISSEMLRIASRGSNQLLLGNSQKLPLRDESFDVAFCRSLLHHLPEPQQAVREMARVLRPGGDIVLVDTNTSLLSSLPRMLAKRGEHFSEEHKNLTRRAIEGYLAPHFHVDDVMYFGYMAYPLLGFPDILPLFKFVPIKSVAEPLLMRIDGALSKIPLIRTQSWGILVKGTKRASTTAGNATE